VTLRFLASGMVGLLVVAGIVGGGLYLNRGSHIEIQGSIRKVRTQAVDDNSAILFIDFRFVNPSNYPFVVRSVDVFLEDGGGREHAGMMVSEADARRLFQYYPLLGQKYNESLLIRARIEPHQMLDRMVSARFEMNEAKLEARKRLRIRVEDVDGAVSELVEGAP